MKNKYLAWLIIFVFLFVASCETIPSVPEEHQGAAKGAAVGAAAGAVLGAVMGGDAKSAVVGGLIGGLVGGVIGHYYEDQKKTGADTARKHNYDPAKGPLLKIEEASVIPQTVDPGDKLEMRMTYAVLTPQEESQMEIIEKREIRLNGELVGNPEVKVSRKRGTYSSSIPLTLPETAQKGLYVIVSTIQADKLSDTIQTAFTVR
jgi:uncharacterized membrane protein